MTLRLGNTLIAGSGANQDLSNLTSTGKNIANWSTNVTNCITEIPQDIKLELNNGTLKLKAGSKVYVPNGAGVFDEAIIANDKSVTAGGTTGDKLYFWSKNNNNWAGYLIKNCYSGSTQPSSGTYQIWYDTTNNLIYSDINKEGNWISTEKLSLPLGVFTSDSGTISALKQVFNGFGYIGSTVFALPNVKGLIPNGRNADGSLRNTEVTINNVLTRTVVASGTLTLFLNPTNTGLFLPPLSQVVYDEINNITTNSVTGERYYSPQLATFNNSGGVITSFTPKTAFHALDYNDSSTISGWAMPSSRYIDLTLLASGNTYTAPANGWFYFSKNGTAGGQFAVFEAASDGISGEISGVSYTAGYGINLLKPVKKGTTVQLRYTAQGATNYFRFVYAEGENV